MAKNSLAGLVLLICVFMADSTSAPTKRSKTDGSRIAYMDVHNDTLIGMYYGEELAEKVGATIFNDTLNTQFAPSEDDTIQPTPFGVLKLGQKVVSSKFSTIYEIENRKNILIKFQANCLELVPEMFYEPGIPYIHPLVRDYIFGKKASADRLAPRMFYLSPPSALCSMKEGKCDFTMAREDFHGCKNFPRSALRYMLMKRVVGTSLYQMKHDYPEGKVSFAVSLAVGYALIKHLAILHKRSRIVHGDIHLDNIMLESINWVNGSVSLQLIDFGRAFPNVPRPAERVRESGWSTHSLFSLWEIDGFAAAARDDIARAVQGIAQLMHPWNYMHLENWISEGSVRESLEHKKDTLWFVSPKVPDVEPYDVLGSLNITMEYKDSIRIELEKVHDFVRGMDHDVNSVPPYGEIMECLGNAIRLYTRGRRSLMAF